MAMRLAVLTAATFLAFQAAAQTPAPALWNELAAKRENLAGAHQEFDVSHTLKTSGTSQSSKRQIVLDLSKKQWREKSVRGSGNHIRIFDGDSLFSMEEDGNEVVRTRHRAQDNDPMPSPYGSGELDISHAREVERRPCLVAGMDACVLMDIPITRWTRSSSPSNVFKLLEGTARIFIDTETGLVVSLSTAELIGSAHGQRDSRSTYTLQRMTYNKPLDASLFKLPSSDLREVKELSRWNAAKIKKQLAGKPAPDFAFKDLQGKPVALSAFKGKTVLLDFWTTWCPPCRADGPALEKLFGKYGGEKLMIVGVSVDEARPIVEKFLKEHRHGFPIVLTDENEMPRPYQVSAFPTYIVIDSGGVLSTVVEGDKGFGDLRKLLKKAGLELD